MGKYKICRYEEEEEAIKDLFPTHSMWVKPCPRSTVGDQDGPHEIRVQSATLKTKGSNQLCHSRQSKEDALAIRVRTEVAYQAEKERGKYRNELDLFVRSGRGRTGEKGWSRLRDW